MNDTFLVWTSAIWLGILTSISPCPLATNIAAISFIGRFVSSSWHVLISGVLYTIGRTLAYLAIAYLVVLSVLSIPELSMFLQSFLNKVLGPFLILIGLILLDLIKFKLPGISVGIRLEDFAKKWNMAGSILIGILFAASFCPVSAALFFGSLIPLAISAQSKVTIPILYGIGTALPVIGFSFIIAFSSNKLGIAFDMVKSIEFWFRKITGVIFILAGIYLIWVHYFIS